MLFSKRHQESTFYFKMSDIDLDRKRHAALSLLQPVCISIMKDCTKSNIETFITSIAVVDTDIAQEIQQYLIFPLLNSLQLKNFPDYLCSDVCKAVDVVLTKTRIQEVQAFFDVFNALIQSLFSLENPNQVCSKSEDTKSAIISSLASLIKASEEKVLNSLYVLGNLPSIGHLVTLLLAIAQIERSRSLQILSLDCLLVLLQRNTKYGVKNAVQLGDLFSFCLPGVAMAMSRIMTQDMKQGHAVLVKALKVWTEIVHLVLSDELLMMSQNMENKSYLKADGSGKLNCLAINRNDEWVKSTADKLHLLIEKTCTLCSHSNWRVRLSLVEMAEQLLLSCCQSLSVSVPKLLELLVGLINDSYWNVAEKSQKFLKQFSSAKMVGIGQRTLDEILEENLHNLTTSLPRHIRMSDEEDKPAAISLLKGYICILGPKISCVTNSATHLRHLSLALVHCLELDSAETKILEERAAPLDHESDTFGSKSDHIWTPKKFFKHFRDENIVTDLLSVCRLLGKFGNVCILVDHFLDLCKESSCYKLAATLIINEIVSGAGDPDTTSEDGNGKENQPENKPVLENPYSLLQDVVSLLIQEYLSTEHQSLVDVFEDVKQANSSLTTSTSSSSLEIIKPTESVETQKVQSHHNQAILLTCLFMEGIGKFAMVLREDFMVHLIQTLYPLVENLGNHNIYISCTAYATLTQICLACGYRSIDHLIQANADYLVNSVSLHLRHFKRNKRTPRLLCVMLRYCSQDLLPMVDHSITEMLDTLDDFYKEDLALFIPVLIELMTAIGKWFPPSKTKEKNLQLQAEAQEEVNNTNQIDPESLVAYVEEYVSNKRIAQGEFTDEEMNGFENRTLEDIEKDMQKLMGEKKQRDEEEPAMEEESEEKKECPKHIQVVKDVFLRVRNLLSSIDPKVRVQTLSVLTQGCKNLQDYEKELLPQLHQIWPGFYPRFHSEEKFVVVKALNTLHEMCAVSGDFLRQRIMKDVMPVLKQFMEKQALISSESRSAYLYTTNYKLQFAVLNDLGPIAKHLSLDGNHLHEVAVTCLPYLSDLQPLPLQQACVKVFSFFIGRDPNAIWLLLAQEFCPLNLQPPSKDFLPTKVFAQSSKVNHFTTNVTHLFGTFYRL